ncbi:MAG: hypothetical protein ACJ714_01580 [Ornithinibacter sp.]
MNTPTTPTPDTPDAAHAQEPSDLTPAALASEPGDSLADQMFPDDGRTTALPITDTPAAGSGATAAGDTLTATAAVPAAPRIPAPASPPEPQWLTGPAPFALVLGLLGLLVAGSVLVGELTDITLPWGDLGPWSVVAAGLVVLLVGAIGLRSSRSRDSRDSRDTRA